MGITNYPNHLVESPSISTLEHIPLKISFLKSLDNLYSYRFISQVEYLVVYIHNAEEVWNDDQKITVFCPNLKGILYIEPERENRISSGFNQAMENAWMQRMSYFISKNIEILTLKQYIKIRDDLRKLSKTSWNFTFPF